MCDTSLQAVVLEQVVPFASNEAEVCLPLAYCRHKTLVFDVDDGVSKGGHVFVGDIQLSAAANDDTFGVGEDLSLSALYRLQCTRLNSVLPVRN